LPTNSTSPQPDGRERMRHLASRAISDGRPLDWYEQVYADAIPGTVPWDHGEPTPYLVDWLDERFPDSLPRGEAVVVGCAYGDDAELIAQHGFTTTAFDISPSAIATAQERHPRSPVHYRRADLLNLPADWKHAFDLVIECTTLQCLPPQLHQPAATAVASLCSPGGTVLVISRTPTAGDPPGPPWLLTQDEVHQVAVDGLQLTRLDRVPMRGGDRWVAELSRPPLNAQAD
jgi:SAM-dependent methyltransferase